MSLGAGAWAIFGSALTGALALASQWLAGKLRREERRDERWAEASRKRLEELYEPLIKQLSAYSWDEEWYKHVDWSKINNLITTKQVYASSELMGAFREWNEAHEEFQLDKYEIDASGKLWSCAYHEYEALKDQLGLGKIDTANGRWKEFIAPISKRFSSLLRNFKRRRARRRIARK